MSAPLAIVSGDGDLPKLLAEDCRRQGRDYVVVLFAGFEPDWAQGHPQIKATFERPAALFKALKEAGCAHVAFAGSMQRPKLNPLKFDWKFLKLAPTLLPALKSGDDVTLRTINAIFEAEELEIVAPHQLLESLLAPEGVLTKAQPLPDDLADMERGFAIARALGETDVGQGVVVAQGLCLGAESIQGTDAMLGFVAQTASEFKTDVKAGRGVLCKAPKPGQDWRVDLPAIGPQTLENTARAGLAGVAVQAGGVLILDRDKTVAKADELGLFLIASPAPAPKT
ncbi:MAG: LpxI family protein [Rhodobacteraceae bacterium]|nr:LpxI family protein [Paracoccaceae bacterium]